MRFVTMSCFAILMVCFLRIPVEACLWVAGEPKVGKHFQIEGLTADDFVKKLTLHNNRAFWEQVISDIENQKKLRSVIDGRNNSAVALIHLGNVNEAIKLLEELERDRPGEYFTASNLGTAYELSGNNQKALIWITEGIKRNKNAHLGTEWLHVKILEAKMALEKDSDWLKNHSVLGADFSRQQNNSTEIITVTDQNGQKKSLAEIESALVYQLHERLEFVKPPEPVVADLLFDLGRVFAVTRTPEHAKVINELSISYGVDFKNNSRYGASNKNGWNIFAGQGNYLFYIFSAIAALLLIGGLYTFVRKRMAAEK